MRSIELTLDPQTDAGIRAQWQALADAGLPSLASHAGESNRPHITVAAGDALEVDADLEWPLPIEIVVGGVLLFPLAKGRFVLARPVLMTRALLDLHARVHAAAAGASEQTLPDAWTPHITLSRRMTPAQVEAALPLLGVVPPGQAIAARLWDGVEKTTKALAG